MLMTTTRDITQRHHNNDRPVLALSSAHYSQIHKSHSGKLFRIHNSQEPNMMLGNSTPSRMYTASCFEDSDHTAEDSTTGENMIMLKQPLIITMSDEESLEGEGQTKLQKERQSRSVICKSFLLGSSFGFALQAMSYAAYYTLFKMFGKDTTPEPGSLLSWFSYCLLVLISQLDLAIYVAIWLAFLYTTTKSGSLYMRKKFDNDAANPNSGSIWTTRMLFMFGVYFLVGLHAGAFSLLVIVDLFIGMAIPLMPLLRNMMMDFVTLFLIGKCFDWRRVEQEPEDDYSCIV
jgi:hypothetical protein